MSWIHSLPPADYAALHDAGRINTNLLNDYGTCDRCEYTYDVASRLDHCPEEGTCWEHCVDPKGHGRPEKA